MPEYRANFFVQLFVEKDITAEDLEEALAKAHRLTMSDIIDGVKVRDTLDGQTDLLGVEKHWPDMQEVT